MTLLGGKRRWVQTFELLEVLRENHSRPAVVAGNSILFYSNFDDVAAYLAPASVAARLPVGDESVYFLVEHSYTDSTRTTHTTWTAHHDPRSTFAGPWSAFGGSSIRCGAPRLWRDCVPAGGRRGVGHRGPCPSCATLQLPMIGSMVHGKRHGRHSTPFDASAVGMPWTTFLNRVRTAAGDLRSGS